MAMLLGGLELAQEEFAPMRLPSLVLRELKILGTKEKREKNGDKYVADYTPFQ